MTPSDPSRCPACGARNSCSQASPATVSEPCWCYSVHIDPERLRALPPQLRNAQCLCPRCAGVLEQLQQSDLNAP